MTDEKRKELKTDVNITLGAFKMAAEHATTIIGYFTKEDKAKFNLLNNYVWSMLAQYEKNYPQEMAEVEHIADQYHEINKQ